MLKPHGCFRRYAQRPRDDWVLGSSQYHSLPSIWPVDLGERHSQNVCVLEVLLIYLFPWGTSQWLKEVTVLKHWGYELVAFNTKASPKFQDIMPKQNEMIQYCLRGTAASANPWKASSRESLGVCPHQFSKYHSSVCSLGPSYMMDTKGSDFSYLACPIMRHHVHF